MAEEVAGWSRPAERAGEVARSTDADLVAQGALGFGVLFDRYGADLYRYFSRRVGSELAQDLTSETFVVAFQRRERYDRRVPQARPWLYGIATNLVRQHRRREAAHYRAVARAGADPLAATAGSAVLQVVERVDAAALGPVLASALAAMPGGQRDVLLLFAAGLEYPEIAAALGVPLGTVQSRLHRARTRMRASIDQATAISKE